MALMKFREPNQVRWQGVRPAHNGTQILANASIVNNTVAVYTVGGGLTGYISYTALGFTGVAAGYGQLSVWNAVPAQVSNLILTYLQAGGIGLCIPATFNPPIELLPGWSIRVTSSAALLNCWGMVHGWEE